MEAWADKVLKSGLDKSKLKVIMLLIVNTIESKMLTEQSLKEEEEVEGAFDEHTFGLLKMQENGCDLAEKSG